jgi:hypothetical protein
VFIITAIVYAVGALGFVLLGKGETQEWAVTSKQALQIKEDAIEDGTNEDEKEKFQLK